MSSVSFTSYRRHLPHRHAPDSTLFLTWRLKDSLPVEVVRKAKQQREFWQETHPKPWSAVVEKEYHKRFTLRIERWLDRGIGECHLRTPGNAKVMSDAFHFFDSQRYQLFAYAVMPNHVHVLLKLTPEWPLKKVTHSLKSFTAKEINKRENRTGPLWQQEVWDRIVRSPAHFEKFRTYILQNPVKANLREGEYLLYDWKNAAN